MIGRITSLSVRYDDGDHMVRFGGLLESGLGEVSGSVGIIGYRAANRRKVVEREDDAHAGPDVLRPYVLPGPNPGIG
jgi:hypothetical protein